jgi:hypothetical protein
MAPALLTASGVSSPLYKVALLAMLGGSPALPACTVEAYPPTVGGYETVYADTVPPDLYVYPHVWYDGGYAYLVGGRWYYPARGRWVVLRQEPPELYRYRTYYVRQAPPAYVGPPTYRTYQGAPPLPPPARQQAPPVRREAPPVHYGYPPPARPVP